jgi:hypothetical protein
MNFKIVLELSKHPLFIGDVRVYCLNDQSPLTLVEVVCIIHQMFECKQAIRLIRLKENTYISPKNF